MYPADQFGILFSEEDLPDELTFNLYSDGALISSDTAQKNATEYGIYWWPVGNTSYALRHDNNDTWGLYTQETINIGDGFTDLGGQRCLIDDPDSNVLVRFEDTFSDTYTGTLENNNTIDFTRVSLCRWEGFSSGDPPALFVLEYINASPSFSEWTMNGVPKTQGSGSGQFNNTPTGIYDWSGIGGIVTVS
jgi:hypothetical protein